MRERKFTKRTYQEMIICKGKMKCNGRMIAGADRQEDLFGEETRKARIRRKKMRD